MKISLHKDNLERTGNFLQRGQVHSGPFLNAVVEPDDIWRLPGGIDVSTVGHIDEFYSE